MSWLYQIIYLFVPCFCYFSFGIHFFNSLSRLSFVNFHIPLVIFGKKCEPFSKSDSTNSTFTLAEKVFLWFFGLLVHLVFSYILYRIGLSSRISFLISFLILACILGSSLWFGLAKLITAGLMRFSPDFSFSCFFFVVSAIGVSIFDADEGIRTLWHNNYSDLMFHLAIIFNYSSESNPLTDYPVYPGVSLSYPILMDFWTACLWMPDTGWKGLSFVFFAQWAIVWMGAYLLLAGAFWGVLPWVLLFSGGSIPFLLTNMGFSFPGILSETPDQQNSVILSHFLIEKGYPFTVFLTTIWIPQRTSILGMIFGLSVLCVVLEGISGSFQKGNSIYVFPDQNRARKYLIFLMLSGMMLGFSLLAHFHISVAVGFYVFLLLLLNIRTLSGPLILFSVSGFIFSLPVLILYFSKKGLVRLTEGWMYSDDVVSSVREPLVKIFGAEAVSFSFMSDWPITTVLMWIFNTGPWILVCLLLVLSVRFRFMIPVFFLFSVINFVSLSVWNWDNIKLLVGVLIIIIAIIRHSYIKRPYFIFILLVLSIMPAIAEVLSVVSRGKYHTVYSREALGIIRYIGGYVPPGSIVAGSPDHNSPITAAGRKIFLGYPGWLWTHSIDYLERFNINSDIELLINCKESTDTSGSIQICPRFIYDPGHGVLWKEDFRSANSKVRKNLRALGEKGLYEIVP
ncbi:MAG TPA: hypothetical protein PKA63_01000 [Oligoflexia bacterium]|nr:hypothetical protein [Oligoflexia bacterium]HMP47226.1 hypothetical protein [Oligoflexia bacterium]